MHTSAHGNCPNPPQSPPELGSSLFGHLDVTGVQGTSVVGCLAQRLVKLELEDEAHKVPVKETHEGERWGQKGSKQVLECGRRHLVTCQVPTICASKHWIVSVS